MAEDQAQRTEPATPKKRWETRRKGQVAQSRDLQSLAVLTGAAMALGVSGLGIIRALDATLRWSFTAVANPPHSAAAFDAALLQIGSLAMQSLAPLLLIVPTFAALVQLAQVGPAFSLEAMEFKFDRMDPIKGFGRFFKPDRWVELLKTLAKVVLISGAAWWAFQPDLERLLGLSVATLGESLRVLGMTSLRVVGAVLAVLAALAAVDVLFQRRNFEKQIRMSKREVRDELKQVEGDPEIRSRYKQRQMELSRTRMIAAVAEADVVVANPTHFAVALRYDRAQMAAPHVVAKGKDRVAARIREAANKAGVPIVEDPPLARVLHRTCEVGREIPQNLFQAVAEVLAVVYRLDEQRRVLA
jgi:flagellar biosynthetic protein FlhB